MQKSVDTEEVQCRQLLLAWSARADLMAQQGWPCDIKVDNSMRQRDAAAGYHP